MYMCIALILLGCFLGAVLYHSNEYANMKPYYDHHEASGPKDMGKLLKMNRG